MDDSLLLFQSERMFRVWIFFKAHLTLLLRSTKSKEHPTRIDVCFGVVDYMDLPTTLQGLEIRALPDGEVEKLGLRSRAVHPDPRFFSLAGPESPALVIAGYVATHEDVEEDDARSAFDVPKILP